MAEKEAVNHPSHYGGANNPYEAIKVIKAWNLGFCLGNTVKYIARAGKKDIAPPIQDLKKALWYLQEEIRELEHKALGEEITKNARMKQVEELFGQPMSSAFGFDDVEVDYMFIVNNTENKSVMKALKTNKEHKETLLKLGIIKPKK